jgi:Family of unknown function (DUF6988)
MHGLPGELQQANTIRIRAIEILSEPRFTADERANVVAAFVMQAVEHHESIALLVSQKFVGSAFALLRPLMECWVRGVWVMLCANEDQFRRVTTEDKWPKFNEMITANDVRTGFTVFQDMKDKVYEALNSYTHTGMLQLGRRFNAMGEPKPSYSDEEQCLLCRNATGMILLLIRPFLEAHGYHGAAVEIDELMKLRPVVDSNI